MSRLQRGRELTQGGRYEEARAAFEAALAEDADRAAAFQGLAVLRERSGDLDGALELCQRALELDASCAPAWLTKGTIHARRRERGNALAAFRQLRGAGLDETLATYFVRGVGGGDFRAPLTHEIVDLFDDYAETFDEHLVDKLRYVGHSALCEVVAELCAPAEAALDVLDLGCGTGLCGPALRPLARHLTGVDLAQPMLDKAAERELYDVLYAADLVYALMLCESGSLDLLTSADVFGYVGELAPVLQEARRVLRPGGRLAFSIEGLDAGDSFQMRPETRRCAYPAGYLRRVAGDYDFEVERIEARTLRVHDSGAVPGFVMALRAL